MGRTVEQRPSGVGVAPSASTGCNAPLREAASLQQERETSVAPLVTVPHRMPHLGVTAGACDELCRRGSGQCCCPRPYRESWLLAAWFSSYLQRPCCRQLVRDCREQMDCAEVQLLFISKRICWFSIEAAHLADLEKHPSHLSVMHSYRPTFSPIVPACRCDGCQMLACRIFERNPNREVQNAIFSNLCLAPQCLIPAAINDGDPTVSNVTRLC